MIDTLYTLAAFIVAIAILIAVHEYGHFITARKLGVKVEKFSIGFGPSLLSWRSRDGEVEYIIAAIPLGGYVKMMGENSGKEAVPEDQLHRAFDRQPIWKRMAIASAGPGFNVLFAIVAYMAVGWLGQLVMPSSVGAVIANSPAMHAGFMVGDEVVSVDGRPIHRWLDLEETLKDKVGADTRFTVSRGGVEEVIVAHLPRPESDPILMNVAGEVLGISLGVWVDVAAVVDDSPAARAGLKAGDRIIQADGVSVNSTQALIASVQSHASQELMLSIKRDGGMLEVAVIPAEDADGQVRIGAQLTASPMHAPVVRHMGFLEGLSYGFTRTWEMTALTLQVMGKMIVSAISPENLGGPIAIAKLAGQTASLGIVPFLTFLALVSVNLAVINLMPVPVLDGGHLVYLGIEKLRGRPLDAAVMQRTQIVGIVLLISLMAFAIYNDLARYFQG
ncbi:MAG: RIP metalloprotease RseP [Mariprofundaceae bacterium]